MHPDFAARYPKSVALGLRPADGIHPGFEDVEVEKALGPERYKALMKGVQQVFCCGHRHYGAGHPRAGYEVHVVYADDVEKFLAEKG
jgi:hypothetical protein